MPPQGTAINDLVNKDEIEYYFGNLAAAATTEKVVLAQITAAIAAMTINNKALVSTNSKLVEEVTNLTRRLGKTPTTQQMEIRRTSEAPRTALTVKNSALTSLTPASN